MNIFKNSSFIKAAYCLPTKVKKNRKLLSLYNPIFEPSFYPL